MSRPTQSRFASWPCWRRESPASPEDILLGDIYLEVTEDVSLYTVVPDDVKGRFNGRERFQKLVETKTQTTSIPWEDAELLVCEDILEWQINRNADSLSSANSESELDLDDDIRTSKSPRLEYDSLYTVVLYDLKRSVGRDLFQKLVETKTRTMSIFWDEVEVYVCKDIVEERTEKRSADRFRRPELDLDDDIRTSKSPKREEKLETTYFLLDDVKKFILPGLFETKVEKKIQTMSICREEAEVEVFTEIAIEELNSVHAALLYVVSNIKPESKARILVNNLIGRGANTSESDRGGNTPLHYAVKNGYKGVAAILLDHHGLSHGRDLERGLPLKTAIENGRDDLSALILDYMPKDYVRYLFIGEDDAPAEISFNTILEKKGFEMTILSVLDCMIESGDNKIVYYNILESDQDGRPPNHPKFTGQDKSPLHIIAKKGNKSIVYHDVVRLLIRKKWRDFAQKIFGLISMYFMLTLFCLTFSGIVAAMARNPLHYDSPLQLARAVFEVASVCMALQLLVLEIIQLRRQRLEYFTEGFNWLDLSSAILILCVIPLRYTEKSAQWHVFAFGYLFWVIRIFEYAAVFRQTGTYAQVLFQTLSSDFIQFGVVFIIILLAFSGSFFLALRGDNDLDTHTETSTFWRVLFVGVRTLTEAQPVVEYTGEDGYGTLSVIFMLCFLFTCYVILLNILIAQLTDTYQNVQQDADRLLEVNRAWIITRIERNSLFFGWDLRKKYYEEFENICDLKNMLTEGNWPPINETNKSIRDSLDNQKMNISTLQHRLAKQKETLLEIQAEQGSLKDGQARQENALREIQAEQESLKDGQARQENALREIQEELKSWTQLLSLASHHNKAKPSTSAELDMNNDDKCYIS